MSKITSEPVADDRVIVGASDAVYAEYSARAEEPFTVAYAFNDEIYSVEGYNSRTAALAAAKAAGTRVEVL
jgi:hypothetical protein